jgi:hypothetical protein
MNHAFSFLNSGHFGDRISLFAQAGMNCDLPILCFLHSWDNRRELPHPAHPRDGVSLTFLAWAVLEL